MSCSFNCIGRQMHGFTSRGNKIHCAEAFPFDSIVRCHHFSREVDDSRKMIKL